MTDHNHPGRCDDYCHQPDEARICELDHDAPDFPFRYCSTKGCTWTEAEDRADPGDAARLARQCAAFNELRDLLDGLDQQTRMPGEKPLRQAVAEQARAALSGWCARRFVCSYAVIDGPCRACNGHGKEPS